jgi:hypothetical protein
MIIAWTVVCLVISMAVCYIGSAYPFAKHIKAYPVAIQGNIVTIRGTVDIYFTKDAWDQIQYKNGSFEGYDAWWHTQIGKHYCFMGVHAQLVYIDWTLLHHYYNHDHLGYVLKVKILDW